MLFNMAQHSLTDSSSLQKIIQALANLSSKRECPKWGIKDWNLPLFYSMLSNI